MKVKILYIIMATVVSGYLSGSFLFAEFITPYAAGVYFGIATALAFRYEYRTKISKLILWVAASCLSWFAAFMADSFIMSSNSYEPFPAFVSAGLLGSLLLATSYSELINKLSPLKVIVIGAIGTAAAVLMYVIIGPDTISSKERYVTSFIIWQLAVALALDLPYLGTKKA